MSAIGSQSFTNNLTTKTITDINNQTGQPGQVLSSTVNGIDWITTSVEPVQQSGTFVAPNVPAPTTTIPYVAGFNKYVCYIQTSATGVPILQQLIITGAPVDLIATTTMSSSANWILTGFGGLPPALTVYPVFSQVLGIKNDNVLPVLDTTITLLIQSATSATFTQGQAIMKLVININLD